MANEIAMDDMDIDFDVDPEIEELKQQAAALQHIDVAGDSPGDAMNGVEEPAEEGEIDANGPSPTKVHLRGLDNLNTNQVRQYAEEHYSLDLFTNVQWVDDTSANLVYDTEMAAAEALAAFSAEDNTDPLQLRRAKPLSTHPDMALEVRQAIVADVKVQNAKDRSRFYLYNPDWDPDNRLRKRRNPREGYRNNKFRRRDREGDRFSRRPSRDIEFHEDMYDEGRPVVDMGRRNSDSEYGRQRVQYEERGDLMSRPSSGRLRDRSASPMRDGDGRYGFTEEYPRRRTPPPRSRTPSGVRGGRDNRYARDEMRKELFPDRRGGSTLARSQSQGGNYDSDARAMRPSSSGSSRELFPDKVNGAVHRRQDARDLHPDEVADAVGRYSLEEDRREPFTYRRAPGRRTEYRGGSRGGNGGGGDLFSRISGGPGTRMDAGHGRLQDRVEPRGESREEDNGFSFKGANQGYSFLGASKDRQQHPMVKELFPPKTNGNNAGKDLFDGRIKGRGGRRRAEDF